MESLSKPSLEELKKAWEFKIFERHFNKCSNCGGIHKLAVKMIVPLEVGGEFTDSNGVVLCRACEMAADTYSNNIAAAEERRPVNFWVSNALYNKLQNGLRDKHGFQSMGALVRYLMVKYVEAPERFDDISQYQTKGSDLKVNVWVDTDRYETFKTLVEKNGHTVTDAIKALIILYESESESLIKSVN